MNFRKYLVKSLWIAGALVLGWGAITLYLDRTKPVRYPPLATHYPPSSSFPQGYADVQMGDVTLRVPREVDRVGEDGAISTVFIWPEFELARGKRYRPSAATQYADTVRVYVDPPKRALSTQPSHQQAVRRDQNTRQNSDRLEGLWQLSTEVEGFLEATPAPPVSTSFRLPADSVLDPFGRPVIVACQNVHKGFDWGRDLDDLDRWGVSQAIGDMPLCWVRQIVFPDGHRILIRFTRKHLKDAFNIYRRVIAFHDSMIVVDKKSNGMGGGMEIVDKRK